MSKLTPVDRLPPGPRPCEKCVFKFPYGQQLTVHTDPRRPGGPSPRKLKAMTTMITGTAGSNQPRRGSPTVWDVLRVLQQDAPADRRAGAGPGPRKLSRRLADDHRGAGPAVVAAMMWLMNAGTMCTKDRPHLAAADQGAARDDESPPRAGPGSVRRTNARQPPSIPAGEKMMMGDREVRSGGTDHSRGSAAARAHPQGNGRDRPPRFRSRRWISVSVHPRRRSPRARPAPHPARGSWSRRTARW